MTLLISRIGKEENTTTVGILYNFTTVGIRASDNIFSKAR